MCIPIIFQSKNFKVLSNFYLHALEKEKATYYIIVHGVARADTTERHSLSLFFAIHRDKKSLYVKN